MAQVLPFMRPNTRFDPEMAAVLEAAYEKAIAALHDGEQPETVQELIANASSY